MAGKASKVSVLLVAALLFVPACKRASKAAARALERADSSSAADDDAQSGKEVSFPRSERYRLDSDMWLRVSSPQADAGVVSVGFSVEQQRQGVFRMFPPRVLVGGTVRVGDYLVTVPEATEGELQKLRILKSPPKLEPVGFEQSFSLSRDVARSFPDGTRLVFGMVDGPQSRRPFSLLMQKDNEWRWHEGLDRDGSGRLGDVLVVYDQLTGSEMPELVAYRGGEQRSLAFAESLRATPLDTIVAPDGLTLRVERFDAFFPALHCTASWAGKTESITIRKSNRPFELGALYRMEIKGGPERTGMPWFELVVDRVADLPQ